MSSSLDSLVNNLARGGHEFWGFESYNNCQCELLIQKGIYPYMSTWIVGISSKKRAYLAWRDSIAISTCLELAMETKSMLALFGENLELEIWENTMTYT